MIGSRTERNKHSSMQAECGEPVADALLRFRGYSLDGLPKSFTSRSLVVGQLCKVIVYGLWF